MKKLKILLDTDIGDEIDDALALYFAMRQGLEIVGITTVFKNTDERARITKRLLKLYGKGYETVPVFAGHGTPLAENGDAWGHTGVIYPYPQPAGAALGALYQWLYYPEARQGSGGD